MVHHRIRLLPHTSSDFQPTATAAVRQLEHRHTGPRLYQGRAQTLSMG
ncbi:hypothetical protein [Streptomyces sp. NPDC086787]